MVIEKLIVFDVNEIHRVRVQCWNLDCGQDFILRLDKNGDDIPVACPHCREQWRVQGSRPGPERRLIQHLKKLRTMNDETGRALKISLELKEES